MDIAINIARIANAGVTLNCQVTKIAMSLGPQLSEMQSVLSVSNVVSIEDCSLMPWCSLREVDI